MNSQDTYIIADSEGTIKIGRSSNIKERLIALGRERGNGITLLAIIPDDSIEGELHQRFEHLRIEGEWYNPGIELLEFIEGLNCNPMTLSEYRKARRKLGRESRIYKRICINCGEGISWNHLLFPDFEYRYENFYRHGKFICLHCYHRNTQRDYICDCLVRAYCICPLDWQRIWRLQKELTQLLYEDGHKPEYDGTHQPTLF